MSQKSYKATAQSLFISKIKTDFPEWEVITADIGTGVVGLVSDDVMVYMTYDTEEGKYYPVRVVKNEMGDTAWDFDTLKEIKGIFSKTVEIPETEGE